MEKGRFAPSPSGRMHLGNLMCSLLAWLSARASGGRVVLRIEDLDAARCPRTSCRATISGSQEAMTSAMRSGEILRSVPSQRWTL